MSVLLDLTVSFNPIDQDNLSCIIEKYIRLSGNAIQLSKLYFSNRTHHVQIHNVLSDFANIICGVLYDSI